jgi:hypothetical protein
MFEIDCFGYLTISSFCICVSCTDFGWTSFKPADAAAYKKKQESELLNGRLAMMAVGGIATQSVLTGHGFPYL